jgi:hypothetical protein
MFAELDLCRCIFSHLSSPIENVRTVLQGKTDMSSSADDSKITCSEVGQPNGQNKEVILAVTHSFAASYEDDIQPIFS